MRKALIIVTAMLALVSCGKKTFTIKGEFDPVFQVADSTEIGIDIKQGEETKTVSGLVKDNKFTIRFDLPEEQLVVLDLDELGATVIAVEAGKLGNGEVNLSIKMDENGESFITKHGTLNNDFIQMYDDYDLDMYNILLIEDLTLRKQQMQEYINKIYRTLKGEENSLTDINTLAGQYGFCNFFPILDINQLDTLCSMMNEKTLEVRVIKNVYDHLQQQKESAIGKKYKDITATTPDGKTLSLSQLVGTKDYILVDFWASWCGPCRRAMPEVKELYSKYGDRLEILGVSLDKDKDAWLAAIRSLELNWKHISDLQGWQAQAADDYGVNAIPATLLIDKEGVIVGRNMQMFEIEALLSN